MKKNTLLNALYFIPIEHAQKEKLNKINPMTLNKFFSILLFISCLISCEKQSENELILQNQKYNYTNAEDLSKFSKDISKIIPKSEGTYQLNDPVILNDIDEMTNQKYTYILMHDHFQNKKVALKLIESTKNKKLLTVEPRLVICGGMQTCSPVLHENKWICDAEENVQECEKSVTLFN